MGCYTKGCKCARLGVCPHAGNKLRLRAWIAFSQVDTAGPEYNLYQTLFGVSVHDANVVPPQDYTISYRCIFTSYG